MQFLLYCIFKNPGPQKSESLRGVDGHPVSFVTGCRLTAAVSRIGPPGLSFNVSHVLAYEKVVASLHHERTVVPVRYGCLFEEEAGIAGLLRGRRKEYAALLQAVDGCVEMGVRVLLADVALMPPELPSSSPRPALSSDCAPGRAYLSEKRERYAATDQMSLQHVQIVEKIYRTLAGLFVRSTSEFSSWGGGGMLSLYFLVARNSVTPFRKAFRRIRAHHSTKHLLTGPWPPYNFVAQYLNSQIR